MDAKKSFLIAISGLIPAADFSAIIGTNPPAMPLTEARIAAMPPSQLQGHWEKYLKRSEQQWDADHAAFFAELKQNKIETTSNPPEGDSARSLSLNEPAAWYGQSEALRIADIVVSFQTPAGGWSKNIDMTRHKRAPGEYYNCDNRPVRLTPADNDMPREMHWSYVGTFDNDATITELRFLAKVITAQGTARDEKYFNSFQRGMDYIDAAQYPNGGWPQVWPLEGGYHDAVTYNDDANLNIIEFLRQVGAGSGEFGFVSPELRGHAAASARRGIECVLAAQIKADRHRTVWCQQHDPLTLEPASARNYEMPSQCGAESANILRFLMELPDPDERTVAAVYAGAEWFKKVQIRDVSFKRVDGRARQLVSDPGAGPIWARYYELKTNRPIFGDRDKTIHDDVNEISAERRNGYSWFSGKPQRVIDRFIAWSKEHPMGSPP